jgi:hypothetical protein
MVNETAILVLRYPQELKTKGGNTGRIGLESFSRGKTNSSPGPIDILEELTENAGTCVDTLYHIW